MSKIEWSALYWIVGTTILSWLLFLSAAVFGYTLGTFLALTITAVTIFLLVKKTKYLIIKTKLEPQLVIFILAWGILFLGLLQTRMLQQKSDGWYSGGATWGDLALHTSFISKFSTQPTLELSSPIYAQAETRYPFLFDFFTAQLVRQGITFQGALIYSSLSLLLASLILFYRIVFSLTKRVAGVWIASCLFFFNGGFGFWYLWQDFVASKLSFMLFLQQLPINYSHMVERDIHFSNVVTDIFLPQRGIVLGFALTLVVLRLWQLTKNRQHIWIGTSILIGLLPLIHVHTFLLLFGCLTWLLLVNLQQKAITLKQAVLAVLPALILGGVQLAWMGIGEQGGHFIKIIHGWMEPDGSLGHFWIKNIGLELFFLTLGNIFIFWKTKQRTVLHHLLPPLIIVFLFGNIVSLQPHVYDNIKLFFYVHLITTIFASVLLLKIAQRSRVLATIFFIALITSGVLSVVRENQISYRLASNEDIAFAKLVRANTLSTAVFLTADNHNHPVPMLAGRSIILGYRGWLWTHGIDYSETESDVRKIYAGEEGALALLKKHRVKYIVIGNEEKQQYKINKDFFYQNFRVVLQAEHRIVFAVQ